VLTAIYAPEARSIIKYERVIRTSEARAAQHDINSRR